MRAFRTKVIASKCSVCREALVEDCKIFGLPLPMDEIIYAPERWVRHRCPHMDDGLVLDSGTPIDAIDIESNRIKDGEAEIEAPEWWNNLDASKGIGYPAREDGRYGSYPSHDGFGDESDP